MQKSWLGRSEVGAALCVALCVACASGDKIEDDASTYTDPTTAGSGAGAPGGGNGGGGAGGAGADGGTGAQAVGGDATGGDGAGGVPIEDTTPPSVASVTPGDGAAAVDGAGTIVVTFSEPMDASSITAGTSASCTSTVQVSADGFATCVPMSGPAATSNDTTFTLTPADPLASLGTYQIRVTTAALDVAQNPLAATFDTPSGFSVAFSRTITIDGVNDFVPATDGFSSSTATTQLLVTHDATKLYVGLASPAIAAAGVGNKFAYFIFSTDPQLSSGQATSSDGKAKFGASAMMTYHYKERVDGPAYSEFRIANGAGWATDWGVQNKTSFRAAGYLEASIDLVELGSPSSLLVTAFTVDYDGGGGAGWVFNMLSGAVDGPAATPRDLVAYVALDLPADAAPNAPSHLQAFPAP